ncbi:diphthine--ammonia ligase [Candidatus Woesearchaeota archaeon]|nr:diphthine--ammonia ligase [Candidatus Woesearchaeota archaeon]
MCGIVGIFNQKYAFKQVSTALAVLQNRGKDGFGIASQDKMDYYTTTTLLNKADKVYSKDLNLFGHALHAVVDTIPQPLKGKGILAANCEIYNWQELNQKYGFKAKNDAEVLLHFLDTFGVNKEKLLELDGVYAFAYWQGNDLYLVRDILGEKPIWFAYTSDNFSFASEKKALEKLGCIDIQELNPRQILHYDLVNKKITTTLRDFFVYLPEHKESYKTIKEKTKELLHQSIQKRIPDQKFGLLFSGGIDSTYIAHYLKENKHEFTCYIAALDSETIPSDLIVAKKIAQELGLDLKIKTVKVKEVAEYLNTLVPLIEDSNVIKVGVALPFYIACEMAKEDGCKVIFSGLGSEEIFAGYERHKLSQNINQECVSGLLKLYERDLYRDDVITMSNNMELRLPFLDIPLVKYALKIPEKYKINKEATKLILRDIALESGLSKEYAFRKKVAAQYGSRFDNAITRLAKDKSVNKSEYLWNFYPTHNLKLGVLFSSGKDSCYSAFIMRRMNYQLTCLITLKSTNPDSYMFQSTGINMVELQAKAMEIPIVIQDTLGKKEKELEDLEKALQRAKEKYKIEGIVSGALSSTYQRDRIERVCEKLGLKIFSPLWHKPQEQELRELLTNGFDFIYSKIAAEGLDKTWLNRKISGTDLERLEKLKQKIGLNVAGEGGESESLVLDCPLFKKKVELEKVEIIEENKNCAYIVITKAKLVEK